MSTKGIFKGDGVSAAISLLKFAGREFFDTFNFSFPCNILDCVCVKKLHGASPQ